MVEISLTILKLNLTEDKKLYNINKKIKVTLKRSIIGSQKDQIATVKGLGLKKTNSSVIRDITPETMGMIKKINHLVTTEEQ